MQLSGRSGKCIEEEVKFAYKLKEAGKDKWISAAGYFFYKNYWKGEFTAVIKAKKKLRKEKKRLNCDDGKGTETLSNEEWGERAENVDLPSKVRRRGDKQFAEMKRNFFL